MSEPDLSPRQAPPPRRRRRWGVVAFLVLVVGALGVILYQGLANATLYFCNADEVGVRSECSGDKRFRLQGTVDNGSVVEDGGTLHFTVTYNGATIPVTYQGDPGGIFQEGIPTVVVERPAMRHEVGGERGLRRRPHPGEAHRAVHRGEPGPGSRRRAMTEQAPWVAR